MSTSTGSKTWWTTLPGVLTAVAGLVTALTGLIVALHQIGVLGGGDPMEPPETAAGAESELAEVEGGGDEGRPPVPAESGAPEPPGTVVLAFYEALWSGDDSALQATLAPNGEVDASVLRFVQSQRGAFDQVTRQLNEAFGLTDGRPAEPASLPAEHRIEDERQSGRRARVWVAPVEGAGGVHHTVDLTRTAGGWKIVRIGRAP